MGHRGRPAAGRSFGRGPGGGRGDFGGRFSRFGAQGRDGFGGRGFGFGGRGFGPGPRDGFRGWDGGGPQRRQPEPPQRRGRW
jgi:hypothetical protein